MNVKVFQFNGCNKCFNESLLLKKEFSLDLELISEPKNWEEVKCDIAVITGYVQPDDEVVLTKIASNSNKVIAYGICSTTGGVFGLANQKGHDISPLNKFIQEPILINGCLGNVDELALVINGKEIPKKNLCITCSRKSTCKYIDAVNRQIELDDSETCFNDQGFLCSGYIAKECKELCIKYGTQCRGCDPMVKRPGLRMIGTFGTLIYDVEMATEASKYGATDKLADNDDGITNSFPDLVGNFFRFCLPTSGLPKGRITSKGSILEDVLTGRLIEELPLITGLLGGDKSISLTLSCIEAYEKGAKIEVSDNTKKFRENLKTLESDLKAAIDKQDADKYKEITDDIRKIAGNMNLSNVFYGGFKTPIDGANFDDYRTHVFEIIQGSYTNASIEFTLDEQGIITKIKIKE